MATLFLIAFVLVVVAVFVSVQVYLSLSHPPQPPVPPPAFRPPRADAAQPTAAAFAPSTKHADVYATLRQLERWLEGGQLAQADYQRLVALARGELTSSDAAPATGAAESGGRSSPAAADAARSTVPASVAAGQTTNVEIIDAVVIEGRPTDLPAAGGIPPRFVRPALPAPVHPLDRPFEPEVPRRPSAPRRALAEVLQAFMEERNIRWGEIISGVLIVVSAVGLVLSLRATLRETIPYFPALMFLLVTGGIHFAGIYSLRRWNLKSTSRGVLIIGTLLVPLNFLAAILLSGSDGEQRPATDPLFLFAVCVGLGAFGAMSWYAARALVRRDSWRLMLAVLGPSAAQIYINRLASPSPSPLATNLLLILPLLCFLVPSAQQLVIGTRRRHASRRFARQMLLELGISLYAVLVPVGLLIALAGDRSEALAGAAPALSLLGTAILAQGILLHSRWQAPTLATFRTLGTGLALWGGGMLLGTVAISWPRPDLLIALGVLDFAVLAGLAVMTDLVPLYVASGSSLALAYVVGVIRWRDPLEGTRVELGRRLIDLTATGQTATAVLLFCLGAGVAAWAFARRRWSAAALGYGWLSAGAATFSLGLALIAGFGRDVEHGRNWASPLLAFFTAAVLSVAVLRRQAVATLAGAGLLWLALVHPLAFHEGLRPWVAQRFDHPWLVATLAQSVLMTLLAVAAAIGVWRLTHQWAVGRRFAWTVDWREMLVERGPWWPGVILPAIRAAQVTSVLALPWAAIPRDLHFAAHLLACAVIVLVWIAASRLEGRAAWVSAWHGLTGWVTLLAGAAWAQRQSWWADTPFDLRVVQTSLIALGLWCVASWGTRRALARIPTIASRFDTRPWNWDRWVAQVLAGATVLAAAYAVAPGLGNEWNAHVPGGTRGFETTSLGAPARLDTLALWLTLVTTLLAVRTSVAERSARAALEAICAATFAAPLLLALHGASDLAVATAVRWCVAGYGLLWTAIVCCPHALRTLLVRGLAGTVGAGDERLARSARDQSILVTAATIVGLTTTTVVRLSLGLSPAGPQAESWFGQLAPSIAYGVPLALLAACLLTHAVRWRAPPYALAGSVTCLYLASLACLIPMFTTGAAFDLAAAVTLVQWLAGALAAYGLVWWNARRWIEPTGSVTAFWRIHWGLFHLAAGAFILGCAAPIVLHSSGAAVVASKSVIASWGGYLAAALCGVFWCNTLVRRSADNTRPTIAVNGLTAFDGLIATALLFTAVVAASVDVWSATRGGSSHWHGYHLLELGWLIVGLIAVLRPRSISASNPLAARAAPTFRSETSRGLGIAKGWGLTIGITVAWMSLAAQIMRPTDGPWWSLIASGGVVVGAIVVACRDRRQTFAYLSIPVMLVFNHCVWESLVWSWGPQREWNYLLNQLTGLTWLATTWLAIECRFQFFGQPGLSPTCGRARTHRILAWGVVSLAIVAFTAILLVNAARRGGSTAMPTLQPLANFFSIALFLSLTSHLLGVLWDRRSRTAAPAIYLSGWLLIALVVDRLHLGLAHTLLGLAWGVTLQIILTGWIWSHGIRIARFTERIGIVEPLVALQRTARWLPMFNALASVPILTDAFLTVLADSERAARTAAGLVPLGLAFGAAFLGQQERRRFAPRAALVLAAVAGVLVSWADLAPGIEDGRLLTRVIRLLMGLVGLTFFYSLVARRIVNWPAIWLDALRTVGRWLAIASLMALGATLVIEVVAFVPGIGVRAITGVEVAAVAVILLGLVAGLLGLAVWPASRSTEDDGSDADSATLPSSSFWARTTGARSRSELARMLCVYGAQLVLLLLFAHVYLSRPVWFQGLLRPWWPYLIVALAFAGIGLGELFQRLGYRVLAEPLQRTGAFLPLFPALGWWIVASDSDYSLLLFLIGVVYVLASFLRRSFASRVAAALAGNGALWALFHRWDGYSVWDHPQLWLIPPAASALGAAHFNRDRLSAAQVATVRYAAVIVIYLSSTSELFIVGVGQSLWPPVILLALSLAGVFLGMVAQVRAFLFLGATFVLLSLVSMVWHASRSIQHVWPWWAFGICSGLAILTLFGVFEKKREEMLALARRLRDWER